MLDSTTNTCAWIHAGMDHVFYTQAFRVLLQMDFNNLTMTPGLFAIENARVCHALLHAGVGAPFCKECFPMTSANWHCCLVTFCFVELKMVKSSEKVKRWRKK